jgi:inward rectifier potassium channel
MFRVRAERGSYAVDVRTRLVLMRLARTVEGHFMYRFFDLPLVREYSPRFAGSWTLMHHITPESPLHGRSLEQLREEDGEIIVSLIGFDGSTGQSIHAQHSYLDHEIGMNERFEDMLSEIPNSHKMRVDLSRFDKTRPL